MSSQAEKAIQQLRRLPENKTCPNCDRQDKTFGFSAVCWQFKTFVCNECKSAHQAYSHRCKSVTMSNWSMEEVKQMTEAGGGGNRIAYERWIAGAPASARPTSSTPQDALKRFINRAYNDLVWERVVKAEDWEPNGASTASSSTRSSGASSSPSPSSGSSNTGREEERQPTRSEKKTEIIKVAMAPAPVTNLLDDMFGDTPAATTVPQVPQQAVPTSQPTMDPFGSVRVSAVRVSAVPQQAATRLSGVDFFPDAPILGSTAAPSEDFFGGFVSAQPRASSVSQSTYFDPSAGTPAPTPGACATAGGNMECFNIVMPPQQQSQFGDSQQQMRAQQMQAQQMQAQQMQAQQMQAQQMQAQQMQAQQMQAQQMQAQQMQQMHQMQQGSNQQVQQMPQMRQSPQMQQPQGPSQFWPNMQQNQQTQNNSIFPNMHQSMQHQPFPQQNSLQQSAPQQFINCQAAQPPQSRHPISFNCQAQQTSNLVETKKADPFDFDPLASFRATA